MPRRKLRMAVVADTNVFVRSFKERQNTNPNRRIIRLWLLERRLQLVVSRDLITEYLTSLLKFCECPRIWSTNGDFDSRMTHA